MSVAVAGSISSIRCPSLLVHSSPACVSMAALAWAALCSMEHSANGRSLQSYTSQNGGCHGAVWPVQRATMLQQHLPLTPSAPPLPLCVCVSRTNPPTHPTHRYTGADTDPSLRPARLATPLPAGLLSWTRAVWCYPEQEVIDLCGLDVAVFFRLLHLGAFWVCLWVGGCLWVWVCGCVSGSSRSSSSNRLVQAHDSAASLSSRAFNML